MYVLITLSLHCTEPNLQREIRSVETRHIKRKIFSNDSTFSLFFFLLDFSSCELRLTCTLLFEYSAVQTIFCMRKTEDHQKNQTFLFCLVF